MRIINQLTTTTVTVVITVELATQEEARDFLTYARAYGKSGVLVEPNGRQRPVRNIEKARAEVVGVRDLILMITDEVDGVSSSAIVAGARELGYTINSNTLFGAIHALKTAGKLRVLTQAISAKNRRCFIYQTVKSNPILKMEVTA